MKEIWKSIKGYENYYEVSNIGNVRSIDRIIVDKNGIIYHRKGIYLKPVKNKSGYMQVALSINNKLKSYTIHSLIAIAFIPNIKNSPTVNHIDGNKLNNTIINLEWATKSEQARHSLKLKLRSMPNSWNGKFGSLHGASKKVHQYSIDGHFIKEHNSIIEAAIEIGLHPSGITGVCKGKHKTAGGYVWKYGDLFENIEE